MYSAATREYKGLLLEIFSNLKPSYNTKCSSVRDYIKILNTKQAYAEFRKIRDKQNRWYGKVDAIQLAQGLDSWSTTKDYEQQVINIIKKLRQDGKVIIKR